MGRFLFLMLLCFFPHLQGVEARVDGRAAWGEELGEGTAAAGDLDGVGVGVELLEGFWWW